MKTFSLSSILLLALAAASAAGQPDGVEAVTRPSADVVLAFVQPGRLAAVEVRDGQRVSKGDVLARLDDEVERLQVEKLKAAAETRVHVEAAEAQVEQRKADLKKLEWAGERGAATQWEIEHARLDVKIGELSIAKATFDRDQARRDHERAKASLDRMRLVAPIDGIVSRTLPGRGETRTVLEVGESVQALDSVMRVVRIDPLWVEVPVPLAQARSLEPGAAATVVFPGPKAETSKGKVVHVSSVADAAADVLTVRVEAPNASGRPAGERVRVRFGGAK